VTTRILTATSADTVVFNPQTMNGVPWTVQATPYQTFAVPEKRRILIVYVSPRIAANSAIS